MKQMTRDASKWAVETFFQMEGSRQHQLQPDFQRFCIWQSSPTKTCEICGLEVTDFDDYEPDHIKPWANGGRTAIANGRVTHSRRNRSRQNSEAA